MCLLDICSLSDTWYRRGQKIESRTWGDNLLVCCLASPHLSLPQLTSPLSLAYFLRREGIHENEKKKRREKLAHVECSYLSRAGPNGGWLQVGVRRNGLGWIGSHCISEQQALDVWLVGWLVGWLVSIAWTGAFFPFSAVFLVSPLPQQAHLRHIHAIWDGQSGRM